MITRVLIFSLLALTATAECDTESTLDFTLAETNLESLEVLTAIPESTIYWERSTTGKIEVAVSLLADGVREITKTSTGGAKHQLTVTCATCNTGVPASRSPATGPWWVVVVLAMMSGFKLQGGRFNTQGAGLLTFTLLAFGTLTLAECPARISITVKVPPTMCYGKVEDSDNSKIIFKTCGSSNSTTPDVGEATSAARIAGWIDAHNTVRKKWHQAKAKAYRGLSWLPSLETAALSWAKTTRTKICEGGQELTTKHHSSGTGQGENIAVKKGSGSWGRLEEPFYPVKRFTTNEEPLNWPNNLHLTQAIWYGTTKVGCAEDGYFNEATKQGCWVYVCRYTCQGNIGKPNTATDPKGMTWATNGGC